MPVFCCVVKLAENCVFRGIMASALIIGGTGLVGSHLLRLIAEDPYYQSITVLARRNFPVPSKVKLEIVNFDRLSASASMMQADHVFCCIGTTIKTAGSQEAFRKVDFDIAVTSAKLALQNGATKYLVVSALGANKNSSIFYSRVKGEMEEAIQSMPYREIWIFHPSILTGKRKEFRPGEAIGRAMGVIISPFLMGPLKKYKPVNAERVARAMLYCAKESKPGIHFIESDEIQALGA